MNASGDSDVSMSFGGTEVYITLGSDGTSSTSLIFTSVDHIMLTSTGDSSVTMIFLDDGLPTKEILTFTSKIFLEVLGDSHLLTEHEGNSNITKEITIKSPIDD